ncbi:ceramide synthase Lac1p [Trichomonascus vanleenenianus]|uniref:ceramide synthase Lac1p n=1 Tax=Trichomonascus vanleenenianus TaxID=2268995 RepID=UPI003ECA573A
MVPPGSEHATGPTQVVTANSPHHQLRHRAKIERRKEMDELPKLRRIQRKQKKTASWATYLAERQKGLTIKALAALAALHQIPALRPHTTKFITIQYRMADGTATIGPDDAYYVLLWIVLLTLVRSVIMDYFFMPIARACGISKQKALARFAEQGWSCVYYTASWGVGMYLLYYSDYNIFVGNGAIRNVWRGWPHVTAEPLFKAYYLIQLACWFSQIYVLNVEERRKDHVQMFTHHIITCALIIGSYYYYFMRVGHVVLVLMDNVDTLLATAKMLKYLGFNRACDAMFGIFLISWIICRHIFYNYITWSVYKDAADLIPLENCYTPEGGRTRCFSLTVYRWFIALLVVLQVITIIWLYMILRVVATILKGGSAEDSRSDDEDD